MRHHFRDLDWARCRSTSRCLSWWDHVPPPRVVSLLMVVVYASCLMIGVTTIAESSFRIADLWGRRLELSWSWMLIIGGILGAVSAPTGAWFAERAAVVLCGVAALMYLGGCFALHLANTPGNQLMQAGWAAAVGVFFAGRWVRIQGATLDPFRGE